MELHFQFSSELEEYGRWRVQTEKVTAGAARSIKASPFTLPKAVSWAFKGTTAFYMYITVLQSVQVFDKDFPIDNEKNICNATGVHTELQSRASRCQKS